MDFIGVGYNPYLPKPIKKVSQDSSKRLRASAWTLWALTGALTRIACTVTLLLED